MPISLFIEDIKDEMQVHAEQRAAKEGVHPFADVLRIVEVFTGGKPDDQFFALKPVRADVSRTSEERYMEGIERFHYRILGQLRKKYEDRAGLFYKRNFSGAPGLLRVDDHGYYEIPFPGEEVDPTERIDNHGFYDDFIRGLYVHQEIGEPELALVISSNAFWIALDSLSIEQFVQSRSFVDVYARANKGGNCAKSLAAIYEYMKFWGPNNQFHGELKNFYQWLFTESTRKTPLMGYTETDFSRAAESFFENHDAPQDTVVYTTNDIIDFLSELGPPRSVYPPVDLGDLYDYGTSESE